MPHTTLKKKLMTRTDIENQLLSEIHSLPIENLQSILDFVVKQREYIETTDDLTKRSIGLLNKKEKIKKPLPCEWRFYFYEIKIY